MALFYAIESQNIEEVKRLIALDRNCILAVDDSNQTALHYSTLCGTLEILKLLLTIKRIDVNAQDINGWTALHSAANAGRYDMCIELLNVKGIRVDLYNSDENGVLVFLCRIKKSNSTTKVPMNYYYQTLQLLQQKGLDINLQNCFGDTPLHYASIEGNIEVVNFLIKNNANVNIVNGFEIYIILFIILAIFNNNMK